MSGGAKIRRALVTGGGGYIGSHAVRRLLRRGHEVTVVDDLSMGSIGAVELLASVREAGVERFLFSSTAAVCESPHDRRGCLELAPETGGHGGEADGLKNSSNCTSADFT